jgi:glycosyltransferase involved in cell wall biosynthesis
MIRVALDGRRLQDDPLTGVGRSLECLLPLLAAGTELTVLTDRRRPAGRAAVDGARSVALPGLGPAPETAWLQVSAAAWSATHRRHVFHGPFNALPAASPAPSVVTIHDLSWVEHPEDLGHRRLAFAVQARWAARHADVILTVSDYTRRAICSTYRVSEERVVVAPNAVAPQFRPDRARAVEPWLIARGIRHPYVVALGGARRRALPVAVEAWRRAVGATGGPGRQLVVVGREAPPPGEGIIHVGALDDDTWAGVLAAAEVFCYPTRYEGFGMPALEAAASGTPVVCAPVAALPEVLGDAPEWVTGPGPSGFAAALGRLFDDRDHAARLGRRGLALAASAPGPEAIAGAVLDAYRRAAA